MRNRSLGPILAALLALTGLTACGGGATDTAATSPTVPSSYPETRTVDHVDTYFGTEVADPYRWLEDLDGPETASWVEAQNAVAEPFLEEIGSRRAIQDRLTALWDYERYGIPEKEGGRYFYRHNDGLQDQSILYVVDEPGGEPHVLIDPNSFSEDRTASLRSTAVSPDGKYIAYGISDGGSDWRHWHVADVETGEDLGERLDGIKFASASWSADSAGFYYGRYPEGEDGEADDQQQTSIYYHRVGTSQEEDTHIYSVEDHPTRNPYAFVTDDGRYLVIGMYEGSLTNGYRYVDLEKGGEVRELLKDWDAFYSFLGNDGSTFYFSTNLDAPNKRVVAIDLARPEAEHWREVVPEAEQPIREAELIGGKIVAAYLQDATSQVKIFDTEGVLVHEVELPGLGTAAGFDGKFDDSETFFQFTGFNSPGAIYRLDVASGEPSLVWESSVAADLGAIESRQVFFESEDGTRVPMFIVHRKGIELDGSNPTLLTAYGGFNVSLTPSYRTPYVVWLEMGGVLAIPNLRGGGEYGEEWHLAGTKLEKQNVFDDFIAAAEWLIDNGYTSSEKLAIRGGSNGGLLVGAVMTQRPDLFGATLPLVGVMDMLRYHTPSANARMWSSDYGLSENEDEFHALYAYSPYHRIENGTCYPPTLVATADHDDRVVPWHSFKFAAAMQAAQECEDPVLIRIETRAGHGAGKPTWMQIEDIANQWAFLAWALGMDFELEASPG